MRAPPALLTVAILTGVAFGVGLFTFGYARGSSYLTNDPAACANCHVMNQHFDAWMTSSHHAVAVCNDCHAPHDFVGKYVTKATNGFWHSVAFTTGRFPDPLTIRDRNRRVTEGACRYCHETVVTAIDAGPPAAHAGRHAVSCLRCHRDVGHRVR
jgi:cytochrome c nitrite reductase small subunit